MSRTDELKADHQRDAAASSSSSSPGLSPSPSTSAPSFLSTLSPRKSAALTTTTKGVAVGQSTSSIILDVDANAQSDVVKEPRDERRSVVQDDEHSKDREDVQDLTLSMRLGSAMKDDFPTIASLSVQGSDTQQDDAVPSEARPQAPSPDEQDIPPVGPSTSSTTHEAPQERPGESETTDATKPKSTDGESGPAGWSSWTSRAASDSMAFLSQGTSSATASFNSAFKGNPFRNLSGAFGRGAASASSDVPIESNAEGDEGFQAGQRKAKQDSAEDDDAHIALSAAESLRMGAKKEEKRRRRAIERTTSEGSSKVASAATRPPNTTIRNVSTHSLAPQRDDSPTSSRSASPSAHSSTLKGLGVFDLTQTPEGALEPPKEEKVPERHYFVLTQAGKPVFLSRLAHRRLAREDAARSRVRARRQTKKEIEEELASLPSDALEQKQRIQRKDQEAEEAEEAAKAHDAQEADRDEEDSAVEVGILQALVSNFAEQGVRTLEHKSIEILRLPQRSSRVVFLLREPLYLVVTSTWHDAGYIYTESTAALKAHLEILYAGLISLISESQLRRLFSRGHNFDLRRMLEGTDGILETLVARLQTDFGMTLGAGGGGVCLRPARLDLKVREDIAGCLNLERWEGRPLSRALAAAEAEDRNNASTQAHKRSASGALDVGTLSSGRLPPRPKDLIYVLVLTSSAQLVTLLRPRKMSAYPVDMQMLINTISGMSRRSARESGTVNWVPICLPRFAPQGMVQAHISWLGPSDSSKSGGKSESNGGADTALVLITADRESFEEVSNYRDCIVSLLSLPPSPTSLESLSVRPDRTRGTTEAFPLDELHLPGLRHFVLKKKDDLQIVWSEWPEDYAGDSTVAQLARLRVTRTYERARELCIAATKRRRKKAGVSKTAVQETEDVHAPASNDTQASKANSFAEGRDDDAQEADASTTLKTSPPPSDRAEGDQGEAKEGHAEDFLPPPPPLGLRLVDNEDSDTSPAQQRNHAYYFRTEDEVIYVECPPNPSKRSAATSSSTNASSASNTGGARGTGMALPPYEVYVTLSPHVPPATARRIAKSVVHWGLGETRGGERWRLWLGRGSVF